MGVEQDVADIRRQIRIVGGVAVLALGWAMGWGWGEKFKTIGARMLGIEFAGKEPKEAAIVVGAWGVVDREWGG